MRLVAVSELAFLTCACDGAQVDVRNQSSTRLQEVVVTAGGDSATIDVVEPSAERKTWICPEGEAGELRVAFIADGRQYRSNHSQYLECHWGYRILVDISPRFEVAVTVK